MVLKNNNQASDLFVITNSNLAIYQCKIIYGENASI